MSFVTRRGLSTLIPPKVSATPNFSGSPVRRRELASNGQLLTLDAIGCLSQGTNSIPLPMTIFLRWFGREMGSQWQAPDRPPAVENARTNLSTACGTSSPPTDEIYEANTGIFLQLNRLLVVLPTPCACSVSSASTRSSLVVPPLRSRPRVSSAVTRPATLARTLLLPVRIELSEAALQEFGAAC